MSIRQLSDIDLSGKTVLVRVDLNVPLEQGKISSDARIRAIIPTVKTLLNDQAHIILMSHLGRPTEGLVDESLSLAPIATHLQTLLDHPVRLVSHWQEGIQFQSNEIILLENIRFNKGEKANDPVLSQQLATLCDVFIMDAFATAHRAQASTEGVARAAKIAVAGPLLSAVLNALNTALHNPQHPLLAIVGGAKVSTKLTVLDSLLDKVDQLIVGGGIANTFLAASGFPIGKSLHEPALIEEAKNLIKKAQAKNTTIPLPSDVVVATEFSANANAIIKPVSAIKADEMILDFGPDSMRALSQLISQAKTILWNGPVGVFEFEPFANGTRTLADAIINANAYTIAGGGDTLAAIDKFGISDKLSYISTGGGAFLEFVEGKALPGVLVLEK